MRILWGCFFVLGCLSPVSVKAEPPFELAKIQGTWEVVQGVFAEKPLEGTKPGEKCAEKWVIVGRTIARRIETTEKGRTYVKAREPLFALSGFETAKGANQLDLKPLGRSALAFAGGVALKAVYSLSGKTLKIVIGGERDPKKEVQAQARQRFFELRRVSGAVVEPPKVLAVGEWSNPVADSRGYAVRGRLMLLEKWIGEDSREIAVHVELEEVSEAVGDGVRIFCDLGKSDFRPEYREGLNCELRDKENRPVASTSFPFSGAVPRSEWVILPSGASIRLRVSPFGIRRTGAMAISPQLNQLWVISDNDPNAYFLSGVFSSNPELGRKTIETPHVWRGTLVLPPLRIENPR